MIDSNRKDTRLAQEGRGQIYSMGLIPVPAAMNIDL